MPLGFLLGWLGSVLDSKRPDGAKFNEVERRIAVGT